MSPRAPEPETADSQPPRRGRFRIDQPILRITSSKMIKPIAEIAALDHPFRQRDRRDTAVIVADHVCYPSLANGLPHLRGFTNRPGERFLAQGPPSQPAPPQPQSRHACRSACRCPRCRFPDPPPRAPIDLRPPPSLTNSAARCVLCLFRPQIVFIRISAGKSKKRGACLQAFECARPMKPCPIMATASVRRFFMTFSMWACQACLGERLGSAAISA